MTDTSLDTAHRAMTDAPEDDALRLKFFERLADSELFLLLEDAGDAAPDTPRLFEITEGSFVLAFDTEDRMARFAGAPAPYAALSGRATAVMLAGQGVGMALNPEVAPSSMLIPADAMNWLATLLAEAPTTGEAMPVEFRAPSSPARLIETLDAKLASAEGLASHAFLADVTYNDGSQNPFLAIVAPAPGAETALAKSVSEALVFSGLEQSALDVAFFDARDPVTKKLERVGFRIDLPVPETPEPPKPDPNTPPRLR